MLFVTTIRLEFQPSFFRFIQEVCFSTYNTYISCHLFMLAFSSFLLHFLMIILQSYRHFSSSCYIFLRLCLSVFAEKSYFCSLCNANKILRFLFVALAYCVAIKIKIYRHALLYLYVSVRYNNV